MIAKKYKLPIQESRGRRGRTKSSGRFLLKVFSPEKDHSRFGVVISRKVAAKATARNQLKRLVFNFIREHFTKLATADYLLIFHPATVQISKSELQKELALAFDIKNAKHD